VAGAQNQLINPNLQLPMGAPRPLGTSLNGLLNGLPR
jgi:hypothetical protein